MQGAHCVSEGLWQLHIVHGFEGLLGVQATSHEEGAAAVPHGCQLQQHVHLAPVVLGHDQPNCGVVPDDERALGEELGLQCEQRRLLSDNSTILSSPAPLPRT